MSDNKKVCITYLYSEVMPYAIAVMRELVSHCHAEVHCIYWDKKKGTPFLPQNEKGITFYPRSGFIDNSTLIAHVSKLDPSLIYVSGTMDKGYLQAALHFRQQGVKLVSGSDNQWRSTWKQRVQVLLSHSLFRKYFEYIWVPGPRQYAFARLMGYRDEQIIRNLYSADTGKFREAYNNNREVKKVRVPHTFVFVGRFVAVKGIEVLYKAFAQAQKEVANDWKLVLVGGKETAEYPSSDAVEVIDFVTNEQLASRSGEWGVFCLPSYNEPWGVVMHEFAAAGLPIICADAVGAADTFVVSGYNGYTFTTGSVSDLKQKLLLVMAKTDDELLLMGDHSHSLSRSIDPVISAYSLMSILQR